MGKVMLLLGMGHCCAPSPPRPRSAAGTAQPLTGWSRLDFQLWWTRVAHWMPF